MTHFLLKLLLSCLAITTACVIVAAAQSTEQTLSPAKLDGKLGYVDSRGRFIIPPKFDEATPFSEEVAAVKICSKDGLPYPLTRSTVLCLWGYIDKTGAYTIAPKYIAAFPFINGVARYWTGPWTTIDKYGIIDKNGREILGPTFDSISTDFFEGLAPFRIGDKWGYVDTKGEIVISARFASADRFSEGLAPVAEKNKYNVFIWGFIDRSGKLIIPPRFSSVGRFSESLAKFGDFNGKYGFVDTSGKVVIKAKFDYVTDFSNGSAEVYIRTNKKYFDLHGTEQPRMKAGKIDRNGNFISKPMLQP